MWKLFSLAEPTKKHTRSTPVQACLPKQFRDLDRSMKVLVYHIMLDQGSVLRIWLYHSMSADIEIKGIIAFAHLR